jgi:hypothetical protein
VTNLVTSEGTGLHVVLSTGCDQVIVEIRAKCWSEFCWLERETTVVNSSSANASDTGGHCWDVVSFVTGKTETLNVVVHTVTASAFIRHGFNLFSITVCNAINDLTDTGVDRFANHTVSAANQTIFTSTTFNT